MRAVRTYRLPPSVKAKQSWRLIRVPPEANCLTVGRQVTVDWDGCRPSLRTLRERITTLGLWDTVRPPFGFVHVGWRRSASGGGMHVRVASKGPITAAMAFWLREVWGDDPVRMTMDRYRFARTSDPFYATGGLFGYKHSERGVVLRAGRWHELEAPALKP